MNITSYIANKCLEFLLSVSAERNESQPGQSTSSKADLTTFSPPWISDTHFFRQQCDGCGICITRCENNILIQDEDGCPQVDFSKGSCSFCGNCAESCPKDLFDKKENELPWNLKAFITLNCLTHNNVMCRTCTEYCAEEAIVILRSNGGFGTPCVLAEKCNGCGSCFSPCPVRAIKISGNAGKEKTPIQEEENR